MSLVDLRYPIGRFDPATVTTPEGRQQAIADIVALPGQLRAVAHGLSAAQLDTPYRDGGWTVRQVLHHVPDSHMNGYVRFKLALTEDTPTIKTYEEARWAELPDVREVSVDVSLTLLDAVHQRWVSVLRGMREEDFERGYIHPDHQRIVKLTEAVGMYAWHGKHHVAHVNLVRERHR